MTAFCHICFLLKGAHMQQTLYEIYINISIFNYAIIATTLLKLSILLIIIIF